LIVYLDTSAIVKRYVREEGSREVSELYERALDGDLKLAFSIWNVGEALVVFDKYRRRGILSSEGFSTVLSNFRRETRRLLKLGLLKVVPVRNRLLIESWKLITRYGVYVADALQIVSARRAGADLLVTGDRRLASVAEAEGVKSMVVG
jgi:predicted nucleic acid-binding protein